MKRMILFLLFAGSVVPIQAKKQYEKVTVEVGAKLDKVTTTDDAIGGYVAFGVGGLFLHGHHTLYEIWITDGSGNKVHDEMLSDSGNMKPGTFTADLDREKKQLRFPQTEEEKKQNLRPGWYKILPYAQPTLPPKSEPDVVDQ